MGESWPDEGRGQLGRYSLVAQLGHGGMAEVFLAVKRGPGGFNKLVVIKQIRAELAEDPEFLGMFLDEARLAARLNHPNVVQTNEVGVDGARNFMAMEYLDGQPLHRVIHRLAKRGGLPLAMHLRILADVLAGLHHAHGLRDFDGTALGVVHRDVNPQNVFVTYDGMVKVVDFGIAKAQSSSSVTRAGVVKGRVSYMAPEQARGEPVDRRVDVFAVGVMLWEAATGSRLWHGMPEMTILKHLLEGTIPSPRTVKPDLSRRLEAIITKAMEPDRERRYPTAEALQLEIEAYLTERGEEVSRREIGHLVSHHFEADREKINAVIDEQLSAPPPGATAPPLPILDPTTNSAVFHISQLPPPHEPTASRSIPAIAPSGAPHAAVMVPRAPGRARRWIFGGAIALAAAALWFGFALKRGPVSRGEAPAAGSTVLVPARPATARLSLSVQPAEARILLDGVVLGQSPFDGALPRDGATHTLRIEAPGFTPREEPLILDRDRVIEVVLTAAPAAPATATPGQEPLVRQPVSAPRPWAAPQPPRKKPIRPLDDINPYAP